MRSILGALLPVSVIFGVVVCNLNLTACGAQMGPGVGTARAPAACAGGLCKLGEYCDLEKNACQTGCRNESTCNPGDQCVKSSADAQAVGACQGGAPAEEANRSTPATPPVEHGVTAGGGAAGTAPAGSTGGTCQAGKSCKISPDCGKDNHCAEGACYPDAEGCPCKVTLDCGKGRHCTNNVCYANKPGVPCTQQLDCGGAKNHCQDGACVENTSGGSCKVRLDCPSKNHCTKGTCHPDAPGSPCDVALDCPPSSACEKGVCK